MPPRRPTAPSSGDDVAAPGPAAGALPAPLPRALPSAEHWGALLAVASLCVAALRQVGEVLLGVASPDGPVLQNFVIFYLVTAVAVLWVLRVATRRPVQELAVLVALGLAIGTLPPLLDTLLFHRDGRHYVYFSDFRWLFASPEQPAGETASIWLALLLVGACAGWVTRRLVPALVAWTGAYALMQVIGGGLPRLVYALIPEQYGPRGILHHALMLSLALGLLAALRPGALLGSLRRLNHALPFVGVTAIGARASGDPWLVVAIKAAVILLASALVIVANDWFDRHQDGAGRGPGAPEREDLWLVAALQVLLVLSVAWFLPEALMGVALFTAVTLAYHHPATRLKRWLGAGYAAEGLAALACLLAGAARPVPPYLLPTAPVAWCLALAPLGFLLASPFKDYKDVDDDRRAGVRTVYTELARRGVAPRRAHRAVAAILTGCLLVAAALAAAAGAGPLATGALAALALLAAPSLLLGSPRAAVERTMWVVAAHLLVVALALPVPPSRLPAGMRFPYASPSTCGALR